MEIPPCVVRLIGDSLHRGINVSDAIDSLIWIRSLLGVRVIQLNPGDNLHLVMHDAISQHPAKFEHNGRTFETRVICEQVSGKRHDA